MFPKSSTKKLLLDVSAAVALKWKKAAILTAASAKAILPLTTNL